MIISVMKANTGTIVLGVILVVAAGMFSANVAGLIGHQSDDGQKLATGAYMTGHVETILTDSQGNVKEYRQSDNVITNTGENCVIRLLFNRENAGVNANSNSCKGALTASWNVIALGTNSGVAVNGTNSGLGTETAATGLGRSTGTVSFTNSTGAASTGAGTAAVATISKTFTNTSGSAVAVQESGLFNSTTVVGSGMFARQSFSTITVGNGDQLTVNWTINVGSTGTFTQS